MKKNFFHIWQANIIDKQISIFLNCNNHYDTHIIIIKIIIKIIQFKNLT